MTQSKSTTVNNPGFSCCLDFVNNDWNYVTHLNQYLGYDIYGALNVGIFQKIYKYFRNAKIVVTIIISPKFSCTCFAYLLFWPSISESSSRLRSSTKATGSCFILSLSCVSRVSSLYSNHVVWHLPMMAKNLSSTLGRCY